MLCSESGCTEISEKISSIKQHLNTMELERTATNEFHAETDFSRYIDLLLQAAEDGYSILITSMDTPCGSCRFTSELGEYKQKLARLYADYPKAKDLIGAIVMNCNPFTLGHQYLMEACAKQCDMLLVFVVQEDKSYFPFTDRIRLVREGCSDLDNVCVVGREVLT